MSISKKTKDNSLDKGDESPISLEEFFIAEGDSGATKDE